jgi:hypothetical protein
MVAVDENEINLIITFELHRQSATTNATRANRFACFQENLSS